MSLAKCEDLLTIIYVCILFGVYTCNIFHLRLRRDTISTMGIYRKLKISLQRRIKYLLLCILFGVVISVLTVHHQYLPQKVVPVRCSTLEELQINTDLDNLMTILKDPNERNAYAWIRMRITKLWSHWTAAIKSKVIRGTVLNRQRLKRKILLYLGFLSRDTRLQFVRDQFKGGYLGELVQWSDLIACLYVLGHQVTVGSEVEQLTELGAFFEPLETRCGELHENPSLIYTDIIGYRQILNQFPHLEEHFKCRVRIMDCFGTEPAFNDKEYAEEHNKNLFWGGLNLKPQQFFTMFPHSPDNSFVGFTVPSNYTNGQIMNQHKENIALVYGKLPYVWQGKEEYLKVFSDNGLSVQATLMKREEANNDPEVLPKFVKNHGYLNGTELHNLLLKAKVFIGLGEPFEGPAPLEAIAHGAVFINPKFSPPIELKDQGKPNERQLTSQNPYVETYIGEPSVYTVSLHNLMEVNRTLKEILKTDRYRAYVPFEFTVAGHIQRISSYVEHQDFCKAHSQLWPPEGAVEIVRGNPGKSCKDACMEIGLVCEPSHFPRINTDTIFPEFHRNCSRHVELRDIYFPAVDLHSNTCVTQTNWTIYSCVGENEKFSRLCPCRNFIPEQIALCRGCEL